MEDQILNIYTRQGNDHTGPHPRPDLQLRNLLPSDKELGLQIAQQTAEASPKKDLRPIVNGPPDVNPFAIDGINVVSPNNPSAVVSGCNHVLHDNHTVKVGYEILNEEGKLVPNPRWFQSGDALWLHFAKPLQRVPGTVTPVVLPILHLENSMLTAQNQALATEDMTVQTAIIGVTYIAGNDWKPQTLCYNNAPPTMDSAKGPLDQTKTPELPGVKFWGNAGEPFESLFGDMLPNDIYTTAPATGSLPNGASVYMPIIADAQLDGGVSAPIYSSGSTTSFQMSFWPYGPGIRSNHDQFIWNSPYNRAGSFVGGTATISPFNADVFNPTRLPATSTITGYTADGTFTVDPPFPYQPVGYIQNNATPDGVTTTYPIYGMAIRLYHQPDILQSGIDATDPGTLAMDYGPLTLIDILKLVPDAQHADNLT